MLFHYSIHPHENFAQRYASDNYIICVAVSYTDTDDYNKLQCMTRKARFRTSFNKKACDESSFVHDVSKNTARYASEPRVIFSSSLRLGANVSTGIKSLSRTIIDMYYFHSST